MKLQRTPRLSLDLLRGFRTAARYLSFTRAAQELCVTQSAISHEVKALEEQLGTPLFARVNRTLKLTLAGDRLYRAVDEALTLIDATTEEVMGDGKALSITTTVPLASLWLGPRLPDFARQHPDFRLRVVASNDNLDIAREHIDIALRHTMGTSPASGEWLFDYETFPVCSPTLLKQSGRSLSVTADLARHVLLDLETVRNGRPWNDWQQWFEAMKVRGLKPAGFLRFSHYDQVMAAAISGAGVAIGRWPHLASHLHREVLVAPLGDAGVARLGRFHLLVGAAAPPGPTDAFRDWLRAEASRDARLRGKPMRKRRASTVRGNGSATTVAGER